MKKYKLTIKVSSFTFGNYESARAKAKELLDAGFWFMDLDEVEEEKDLEEEKLKNSEQKIKPVYIDPKILKQARKPRWPKRPIEILKEKDPHKRKRKEKLLFSKEIDKIIKENWKNKRDLDLVEIIKEEFDETFTVDQIKWHRRQIGCVKSRGSQPLREQKTEKPEKLKGWAKYHADKKEKPKDPYRLIVNGKPVPIEIMRFIEKRKDWEDMVRLRDEIIMVFEKNYKLGEIKMMQGQFIKKKPVIKIDEDLE